MNWQIPEGQGARSASLVPRMTLPVSYTRHGFQKGRGTPVMTD